MSEEITGSVSNREINDRVGNVYYLNKKAVGDVTGSSGGVPEYVTGSSGGVPEYSAGTARQSVRYAPRFDPLTVKPLDRDIRDGLQDAFHKITDALDTELSAAERSNFFDEWVDLLQVLSRKGQDLSGNHRKILGCLISATVSKDISDFEKEHLRILQEATNTLRQPRVTKTESKRTISTLLKAGFEPILNLAVDNLADEAVEKLEKMRAAVLRSST